MCKRRMREKREKLKGRMKSQYSKPYNNSLGFVQMMENLNNNDLLCSLLSTWKQNFQIYGEVHFYHRNVHPILLPNEGRKACYGLFSCSLLRKTLEEVSYQTIK